MNRDILNAYTLNFEELLSDAGPCESWRAVDEFTGAPYFVKRLRPDAGTPYASVRALLRRSYELQSRIRSFHVNTALRMVEDGDTLYVVYPFLDSAEWRPLNAEGLGRLGTAALVEACALLDYLHLLGLVHGDLKLEHFLVREQGVPQLKLVDLDFLCEDNARPNALLFGTPGLMAPEIRLNERILIQSDAFALGTSLRHVLDDPAFRSTPARGGLAKLSAANLVDDLTQNDALSRPFCLVNALAAHGIIGDQDRTAALKRVFAMYVLNRFRVARTATSPGGGPAGVLGERYGIFGIPQELLAEFARVYQESPRMAFGVARSLLEDSEVSLFGRYWQIRPSDESAHQSYQRLLDPPGQAQRNELLEAARDGDVNTVERVAQAMLADQRPLLAYLVLSKGVEAEATEAPRVRGARARLLGILADTAVGLGRPAEAYAHRERQLRLIDARDVGTEAYLRLLSSQVRLAVSAGDLESAASWVGLGVEKAAEASDRAQRIEFERLSAWLAGAKGNASQAEATVTALLAEVKRAGLHAVHAKLLNDLGTLHWRQGRFQEARASYEDSLKRPADSASSPWAVRSLSGLAMIHYELADYKSCLKYATLAMERIQATGDRLAFDSAASHLVLAHVALGRFAEAEAWLQRLLRDKADPRDRRFYGSYYGLEGRILLEQGRVADARASLLLAVQILDGSPDRFAAKAHQLLAELAFMQGKEADFRSHVAAAHSQFESLGDATSSLELKCWESLFRLVYSEPGPSGELLAQLQALVEAQSHITAAQILLILLLEGDTEECGKAVEITKSLLPTLALNDGPAQIALRELLAWRSATPGDDAAAVPCLKRALQAATRAGHLFGVCRICATLAAIYHAKHQARTGVPYLDHAVRIAAGLQNEPLRRRLEATRQRSYSDEPSYERLVQTLHGISEILRHVAEPDRAFERMVEYAMLETGAERGVLLLRALDGEELQVRASVNCDGNSLRDIEEISRQVPLKVMQEGIPIVIGDAAKDASLKSYKSIALHNILSILCVPISRDRERIGVIYLDHHTVPALFDKSDVLFVQSAANVIAGLIEVTRMVSGMRHARDQLREDLTRSGVRPSAVIESPVMSDLYKGLADIAGSKAAVLLLGETGVGKEVVAESIHQLSQRRNGPLIRLNCAAVAESMVESELFGVADRAATNVASREGKFAAADGGTLFLDEIGDMSAETQARVLRALEDGTYEKVGSNRTLRSDVRIIAASNKDLEALVEQGTFRRDLFYRISTFTLRIPPLRKRQEDIPALADHFARTFAGERQLPIRFSREALDHMLGYAWPGNVRELRNLVEKLTVLHRGQAILPRHLPEELLQRAPAAPPSKKVSENHERQLIIGLLEKHGGNRTAVARELGCPLTTLLYRMRKYRIA